MDYQWDKNELDIDQDVLCLCGTTRCRRFLMRAKSDNLLSEEEKKESVKMIPRSITGQGGDPSHSSNNESSLKSQEGSSSLSTGTEH